MRVLVVGGAGYIGSVTVEQLRLTGHEVRVFDNLSRGHRAAIPADVPLIEGDLSDRDLLEQVLKWNRIDVVMHFAALSLVGESMTDPALYYRQNVANGLTLLEAMRSTGVNRFIFSSTAAVYGEPELTPISEQANLQPTSVYGDTKLAFERLLHWFSEAYGLRYVSLRYFNAAGASEQYGEDHHPETHLIPLVLEVALGKRLAIKVFGNDYPTPDGTCIRDYIHVVDLAQAHVLAMGQLEKESRIYNLGNGQGFSVQEVIEAARRVTGRKILSNLAPRRAGDPAVLIASSSRIRAELGWTPRFTSLDEIIQTAWDWHLKHPNGYEQA